MLPQHKDHPPEEPHPSWDDASILRDLVAQRVFYNDNVWRHENDECVWVDQSSKLKNNRRKLAEEHIKALLDLGYTIVKGDVK